MARYVLPVVGAVVGFIYGGPQGAMIGWSLGATVGGMVDPQTIKGPSIGDLAQQTSQEGVPRPIIFGLSQPIAGNVIATSEPRIVKKTESGGKGGPKVKTESVFRTYAIRICEGPITNVLRVWRNNTLVYDAREDPTIDPAESAEFLEHARFFLGTYDQNPSPDLEAVFGVGTTPAHRGTCYMVVADEDLTDLRGAIPQYTFQVERCEGYFLTSRPYAVEVIEGLLSSGSLRDVPVIEGAPEAVEVAAAIPSGDLAGDVITYDDAAPEAVEVAAAIPSGDLAGDVVVYDDAAPEAVEIAAAIPSGDLAGDVIAYSNYPPEALESSGGIASGDLT